MTKITKEQVLDQVQAAFGFVPHLMSGMAEQNPAVAAAYLAAGGALESGVLTAAERQVVMLAVSAQNECHYCTAAHRTVAGSMGVKQAELEAIDALKAPEDARLRTLVEATWTVMRERGFLDESERARCRVSTPELYEIIAIVGMKTISNYINHVQRTKVDEPLRGQATRAIPAGSYK
jgi:AhpD family alkylhydroperoxidase